MINQCSHNHTAMSYNLYDYIYKIDDFLDQSTCKSIVKKISKLNWAIHSYHNATTNTTHSYDNDLSVLVTDIPEVKALNEKIKYAIKFYIDKFKFSWYNTYTNYTYVRMNKYDKNTTMRLHCDHIHSIFDGNTKGVPILTILGSLNNEYKGGELIMFNNNEPVQLRAGNLLVFPSNFLYPHEVKPVISGTRYSYVSWSW
jgi:predicted 2-oxoglutarate/Fe(II)-dependent dioxygenase YbiX